MKALISTKQFSMRYSPKAVISPIANRYILARTNPIRPKIQHMWKTRDPNTLWWRVSNQNLHSYKRVIRSWCARRARLAFGLELKSRGFDTEGRQLETDDSSSSSITSGISGNIKGSVNIMINPACIHTKYSEVQSEMKILIDALLQQHQHEQLQAQKHRERGK